ncbi:MAG: AAA family ATPase, partial [Methylophaga sp.]|nr:AAA family ATPase [Methylophaga sp.]
MEGLLAQIQQGEGQKTEFKTSFQKEVIESVVAFANAKGGKIFIGISDSEKIMGITVNAESIQNYINSIKQNTQPNIIVDINEVSLEEKTILVIDVQEQPIKPIAYKNRYFKRVNNSNHLMSLNEIANEHLKTMNESWDCHIDTLHDFEDISIDKAIKLIERIEHYQEKKFNDDIFSILKKYELIKNEQLTFGAYLLFVSNISSLTGMQIGRFKTETKIIDSLSLNTDVLTEVEKTLTFIRKNLMVEYIITGEPQRIERYDYPL